MEITHRLVPWEPIYVMGMGDWQWQRNKNLIDIKRLRKRVALAQEVNALLGS